jgi:hydroxypyruvate isomerase
MPRFAANISTLFQEMPFLERPMAAAKAGFTAVECQFPYAVDAGALRAALDTAGTPMVLHNLPAGDWASGDRGLAGLPDRKQEFRASVDRALHYAMRLGCKQLNCLAGVHPSGLEDEAVRTTLIDNLRFAADRLGPYGLRVLVEPINQRDVPGFLLYRSAMAVDILDMADRPNLFLQYDIYHMQVTEGDLANRISALLPRISHIQIADNPGRREPGTGEIAFPFLFRHLDAIGYAGWVGSEYFPLGDTRQTLAWLLQMQGKSP